MTTPPLIVGTLHSRACLQKLAKKPQSVLKKIDLLEIRLDSLSIEEWSLLPSKWSFPVIATARHPAEGGLGNCTLSQRRQLLEESLSWATAIDVELRSAKQLASTIARARKTRCLVILSFHDFQTVPSVEKLETMASQAQDAGADLFKVAGTVQSDKELIRLTAFQYGSRSTLPIATMGMGKEGKRARLLLAALGSALVYGWLYHPHVSGQWSAEEWSRIIPLLF